MLTNTIIDVPSFEKADFLLAEAEKMNPGLWVEHTRNVGKAAELIAKNCCDMNADTALVLGSLHDIGNRYVQCGFKHTLLGYQFCMGNGYHMAARICLTHSFDCQDIRTCFGKWENFTEDEFAFVKDFVESAVYDDYDRLIQLCDALALPGGFCIIEKRMIDVALRHGVHEHTTKKWKATFQNKQYFEEKMGRSIYSILPGVIENSII